MSWIRLPLCVRSVAPTHCAALDSAVAQGTARDTASIDELRHAWRGDTAEARWEVLGQAGFQAYSNARRDPLHPGGPGGLRPYVDLGLTAVFGNFVLVSRPAVETRLIRDPDWSGRKDLKVTGRQVEGYLSAQFRYARIYYGEADQNWGPVGLPGSGSAITATPIRGSDLRSAPTGSAYRRKHPPSQIRPIRPAERFIATSLPTESMRDCRDDSTSGCGRP